TVCVNGTPDNLTAEATGADSFNWYYYSDPNDPATRTHLVNTTTGLYTPGAELDVSVVGEVLYEVTAVYACGESPGSRIEVEVSNTGACGGGGGPGGPGGTPNCAVFTSTVTEVRPSCSGQDDGEIALTLTGGSPSPNYVVTLFDSTSTPVFSKAEIVAPGNTL